MLAEIWQLHFCQKKANLLCNFNVSWSVILGSVSVWGVEGRFILQVGFCMSVSHDVIEMWVGRWCLHHFVFLFSESQESNNEYGCSYSVMRVVGNGSTVILNSISLTILSDDQLKCNGQPAVFCLGTMYTCISVTCRQISSTGYHYAFNTYILHVVHITIITAKGR